MRRLEAEVWERHLAQVDAGGGEMTPGLREATAFDLSDCKHVQRTFAEVENEHGVWGCEICVECGKQVAGPECPHVFNEWVLDGRLLICANCGIDVT